MRGRTLGVQTKRGWGRSCNRTSHSHEGHASVDAGSLALRRSAVCGKMNFCKWLNVVFGAKSWLCHQFVCEHVCQSVISVPGQRLNASVIDPKRTLPISPRLYSGPPWQSYVIHSQPDCGDSVRRYSTMEVCPRSTAKSSASMSVICSPEYRIVGSMPAQRSSFTISIWPL